MIHTCLPPPSWAWTFSCLMSWFPAVTIMTSGGTPTLFWGTCARPSYMGSEMSFLQSCQRRLQRSQRGMKGDARCSESHTNRQTGQGCPVGKTEYENDHCSQVSGEDLSLFLWDLNAAQVWISSPSPHLYLSFLFIKTMIHTIRPSFITESSVHLYIHSLLLCKEAAVFLTLQVRKALASYTESNLIFDQTQYSGLVSFLFSYSLLP